jgi:acetyltransferase-like isoleucine patch superfamily enzyme
MQKKLVLIFILPLLLLRHRGFIAKHGIRAFRNSLRINFKCFDTKTAKQFPIYVSANYVLKSLEGKIVLPNKWHTGIVQLGTYEIGTYDTKSDKGILDLKPRSQLVFEGKALLGVGCRISINENATLTLGDDFTITAASTIICSNKIHFGAGCLLSWEILIMDSDLHTLLPKSTKLEEVYIGAKNWIGARSTILKSTKTGEGCVIGANSLLSATFGDRLLIAGNPAKVLKDNVSWE